jgi:hypothetical protein
MNAKEVLVAAKNLLSDPNKWTKGAMARNINMDLPFYAKNATCWCALGAVNKVLFDAKEENNAPRQIAVKHLSDAAHKFGYRYISDMNDAIDHTKLMQLFDVAIELSDR